MQKAIRAGTAREKFPVGTEIPDTFYGVNNPAIVMHYGKVLDKVGGEHDGAWLMFKYVSAASYAWASSTVGSYFGGLLPSVYNGFYSNECSDELKSVLQEFQISCYDANSGSYVTGAVHLCPPSERQLYGDTTIMEGEAWDYMKVRTGLSAPSNGANSGRIFYTIEGGTEMVKDPWTRSVLYNKRVSYVRSNGSIAGITPTDKNRLLVSFALF